VGTFLDVDETLDETAQRALRVKAGIEGVFVEQLFTFGELGRDPRTRVLSVAYYALVEPARLEAAVAARKRAGTLRLARVAGGVAVDEHGAALDLPFDHDRILATAMARIQGKLGYSNIGFELLGERFTLRDLRLVYEAIEGHPLNKDSFRRTVLNRDVVEPTGEVLTGVGHRPPALYRFRRTVGEV
jgi:8-oxo-dGTP diphosphatase